MEMIRRRRDGQTNEDGFHWLQANAAEYVEELINEFEQTSDLRVWLLELIGEARSSNAFPFFAKYLQSNDWGIRKWVIIGLKKLNTKEARTLLWKARSFELATQEDTERLRMQLDRPDSWWLD